MIVSWVETMEIFDRHCNALRAGNPVRRGINFMGGSEPGLSVFVVQDSVFSRVGTVVPHSPPYEISLQPVGERKLILRTRIRLCLRGQQVHHRYAHRRNPRS